jgi:hypothetical protein
MAAKRMIGGNRFFVAGSPPQLVLDPKEIEQIEIHAILERPLHLTTTLLAKQQVICFVRRSRV